MLFTTCPGSPLSKHNNAFPVQVKTAKGLIEGN